MLIYIFEYRFLLLDKFNVWNELRNEVVQLCFYWTDRSLYLWWVIDEQTGMSELVSHLYGELSWQLLKEMKDAYQSWYYLQPIKHSNYSRAQFIWLAVYKKDGVLVEPICAVLIFMTSFWHMQGSQNY